MTLSLRREAAAVDVVPLEQFEPDVRAALTELVRRTRSEAARLHLHVWVAGDRVSLHPSMAPLTVPFTREPLNAGNMAVAVAARALEWVEAAGLHHVPLHLYVDQWLPVRALRQPDTRDASRERFASRLRRARARHIGPFFVQYVAPSARRVHRQVATCAPALLGTEPGAETEAEPDTLLD